MSNAAEGLDENSKQAYLQNNDRNLSSSLDAMLKLGGSANLVSDLYDRSSNSIQGFALADQKARKENLAIFMAMQQAKASQNRDQFFLNKIYSVERYQYCYSGIIKAGY